MDTDMNFLISTSFNVILYDSIAGGVYQLPCLNKNGEISLKSMVFWGDKSLFCDYLYSDAYLRLVFAANLRGITPRRVP